jgi:hypothetical protein
MKKRCTYDAAFKRKVITSAEKIGRRATGRNYAVSEACVLVRHWRRIKQLFSCLTNRKSPSGPRKARNPEADACVLEYFKDLRNKGFPVIREALMSKAKERARNSNIPFKANRGRCEKYMKAESLSIRRRTKISQKLPSGFENKLIEFQCFVIVLRRSNKHSLIHIDSAGETAVSFDMPRNYITNFKGGKTSGKENNSLRKVACYCHAVYNRKWQ